MTPLAGPWHAVRTFQARAGNAGLSQVHFFRSPLGRSRNGEKETQVSAEVAEGERRRLRAEAAQAEKEARIAALDARRYAAEAERRRHALPCKWPGCSEEAAENAYDYCKEHHESEVLQLR